MIAMTLIEQVITSASPKYLTGKKLMMTIGMKQIVIQIAAFNGDQ